MQRKFFCLLVSVVFFSSAIFSQVPSQDNQAPSSQTRSEIARGADIAREIGQENRELGIHLADGQGLAIDIREENQRLEDDRIRDAAAKREGNLERHHHPQYFPLYEHFMNLAKSIPNPDLMNKLMT
jgi:hypothetical protein